MVVVMVVVVVVVVVCELWEVMVCAMVVGG